MRFKSNAYAILVPLSREVSLLQWISISCWWKFTRCMFLNWEKTNRPHSTLLYFEPKLSNFHWKKIKSPTASSEKFWKFAKNMKIPKEEFGLFAYFSSKMTPLCHVCSSIPNEMYYAVWSEVFFIQSCSTGAKNFTNLCIL